MSAISSLASPADLATLVIALNLVAFIAFGLDKRKAEAGTWRIAESTLLMWALLGGTVGAYAGRSAFRHKTRKQPFSRQLHTIAVLQVLALAAGLGWMLGAPEGSLGALIADSGLRELWDVVPH